MRYKDDPYYGNKKIADIRRRKKLNKRVRRVQLIVGTLAVAMLLVGMSIKLNNKREYIEDTVVVLESTGTNTLWGIAVKYCPDDMDKRTYIEYIKQDNNCTELIYPGDVLTIRRYEE